MTKHVATVRQRTSVRQISNGEERGKHRDQNAGAGYPEGNASDQAWIQIAAP